jgi:hypothetical protein
MKTFWTLCVLGMLLFGLGNPIYAQPAAFARLIIVDTRGSDAEETVLVVDQHGSQASIWLKNYLGERRGSLPVELFQPLFNQLRSINEYAIKSEYRGKGLRAHAAHGTITLAWQDPSGKQIKTIRYYAPEHNLDDFRQTFNSAWALARFAILSLGSMESNNSAIREDALYFLSGSGWLTSSELEDVTLYWRHLGQGEKVAQLLWKSLDVEFPRTSDFAQPEYLAYCVEKGMVRLGTPAVDFLAGKIWNTQSKNLLAVKILKQLRH